MIAFDPAHAMHFEGKFFEAWIMVRGKGKLPPTTQLPTSRTDYVSGGDRTHIGVTFPFPRMSRAEQTTRLKAAGARFMVDLEYDFPNWRDLLKVTRSGDTIYLIALVMLPRPRGDTLKPTAQVAAAVASFIEHGANIVEVHTRRRSGDKRQREAMLSDAISSLRGGGRRLPPGITPPGRPRKAFSPEQIEAARAAWFNRDYATDRIAAKYAGMSKEMCRRRFKSSGRPWLKRRNRNT